MDYRDIAATYNASAEAYAKFSLGREDAANLVRLAHTLRPGAAVLDIGCAAGRDCGLLQSAGFSVTGADISARLLAIAKKAYPDIPFVLADMRSLPFKNQSFDAVWASAVLHHAERKEMQHVLREFNRVLKPAGFIYIMTKFGKGVLQSTDASVAGKERSFTLLSESELDSLLKEARFKKQFSELRDSTSRKNLRWLYVIAKKTGNINQS